MTKSDLIATYQQRAQNFAESIDQISRRINWIANLRILAAIIILITVYFSFTYVKLLLILSIFAVVFAILVARHSKLFGRRKHLQYLLKIQEDEMKLLQGDQAHFDAGKEFIDTHHAFTHDLDIFGDSSLFQHINRSKNAGGKKEMAARLAFLLEDEQSIKLHQEAVRDLANRLDFRHTFQALEKDVDEQSFDRQQLQEWIGHESFLYGRKFYGVLSTALPGITISLLLVSFFVAGLFKYFLMLAFIQWIILGVHLKKINRFHQYISNKRNILDKYSLMLKCIRKNSFDSSLMKKIAAGSLEADEAVSKLSGLVGTFDARLNFMTNLFVNSIGLFDMQCVYRLEKWKATHAQHLDQWLDALHETELLCSFATFAYHNQDYTYPRIVASRSVHAIGLGHPLLDEEERIVNHIELDEHKSIVIITGANMAGKSTFLRTIGVNLVLALSGAPVCAREFSCSVLPIRSGMRTADSLHDHQSYFYAELNRLKGIVDDLKNGKELFILLDEILKGTNSTDKQAGSIALVRQLLQYRCLTLIATHDLLLGELEKEFPEKIRNYCFEPFIENDQLAFDYLLKPGIATRMNATFLMKKMGIIPGI